MQSMNFRVGAITVLVFVVAERPRNQFGEEVDAIVNHDDQEIYIYNGVRGQRREHRLRHEIGHVKRDIWGAPDEEEAACDLDAAFWQQFDREFQEQGGAAALGAMVPEGWPVAGDEAEEVVDDLMVVPDTVTAGSRVRELTLEPLHQVDELEGPRLGTARRRDCVCGRMVYERRIVDASPRYESRVGGWVVDRALFCDDCCHVQRWIEGVGPEGLPNGVAVDEPVLVTGRDEVAAFLREHPHAAGVAEVL